MKPKVGQTVDDRSETLLRATEQIVRLEEVVWVQVKAALDGLEEACDVGLAGRRQIAMVCHYAAIRHKTFEQPGWH
jgi:hypothetical protein